MARESPHFSIVIPTYNRPRLLAACLESLARLDCPRDRFEVIVVDDGGDVGLETVVVPFRARLDLTLLQQANAGPGIARNTGAAHARGQFVAFVDDDCAPAPDWLRVIARCFEATPDRAIGGRTINALPANPYSTASQVLVDYVYAYNNADFERARFFASNNLALPADRFRAVGGFAAPWPYPASEDRELCDRWLHRGYRMTYAPAALVYHAHPLTFRSFWHQHFSYGRGAFGFHRTRARRGSGAFRIEPAFYLGLPFHPLSAKPWRRALLLAALLVLSQAASAAGLAWQGLASVGGQRIGARHRVSGTPISPGASRR